MLTLRDYQREAIDATYEFWRNGGHSPLVVVPTGGGKSAIIGTLMRELIEQWKPDMRIVSVTHVKELVSQNFMELLGIWPGAPAGIYSAGLGKRDISSQIIFAGIQSITSRAHLLGHVDMLLVDEAHMIPRNAETRYGQFIAKLKETNPDLRIVGFTATPYRLDSGKMDSGDGALFDGVSYEVSVAKLIEDGYLAPPTTRATELKLDVSGVGRRGGEFIAGQLEKAVDKDEVTKAAVGEIVARGADRKRWLIFCAGIAHAEHVADELRRHDIPTAAITGDTNAGMRDALVQKFKDGSVRALCNVSVLTTGFNVPAVDLIGMLRPTESTGLYVQMIGRGTRIAPGKRDCLVLDFAGNIFRHGPIDAVDPREPGSDGDGER